MKRILVLSLLACSGTTTVSTTPELREPTEAAISAWNLAAACADLELVPQGGDITIAATNIRSPYNGRSCNEVIDVDPEIENGNYAPVIAHELGHAMGLKHSPDPRDIMWPNITGLSRLVVTERDAEALCGERK